MPRLSNALYYDRYRFLRSMWLEFQDLYTILWPIQQWEVHAYYQPSKDLTKAELLEHRKVATKKNASLPAKAGKHFDLLYRSFRVAFAYSAGDEGSFRRAISQMSKQRPKENQSGDRQIYVRALAKGEPDVKTLARAFMMIAMQQQADTAVGGRSHDR